MTRASTTLFWFSLTIFVSLGLYHTSYRVEDMGRQLRDLNSQIEAEQRNLHVLKAEWVFLSNPSRIEAAARQHLDLKPTAPEQITSLGKLASLIPSKAERVASAASAARLAAAKPRPAANKPMVAAEETGRLNTRLVIQKTASAHDYTGNDPWQLADDGAFALANTGNAP